MQLYENERIDYVNDNISLIQKTGGLTFGTDALLLAGYMKDSYKVGVELGAGSGIISMLALTRDKIATVHALEVQADYAALTERNAELNSLSHRLFTHNADVREVKFDFECDVVFTNPPYMKSTSGKSNLTEAKNIARHEVHGDIRDFVRCAARLLKFGGAFYAVYRPDRMMDLLAAMREYAVEPKRITAVHANERSEPSMILVEGKRGARSSLKFTRPLIIYRDASNKDYSDDMNYIMENGVFPADFQR